jgi:hypothetical protein
MPKEYLDKIRAKYPQYADIPDTTLAQQIIAKHPEYQDILGDMTHTTPVAQSAPADQSDPSYGERVLSDFTAPGKILNEGISLASQGGSNLIPGVAKIGNAIVSTPGALAAPLTAIPGWIGQGVRQALGAPQAVGNAVVNPIASGLSSATGATPFLKKNFPQTAQGLEKASTDISSLAGATAAVGVADVGAKVLPDIIVKQAESAQAGVKAKIVNNLKRVAPPTKNELNWGEAADRALPYLKQQNAITPIQEGDGAVRSLAEVTSQAKQGVFDKYNSVIQEHPEITIGEGTAVPDAIRKSAVTPSLEKLYPAKAEAISNFADKFAGPMPVPEVFEHLKTLNADLNAYYKMSPEGRAAADATGVPTAAKAAAAEVLRKQAFDALEKNGVTGVDEARKDYGALNQMQKAIERNIVGAEKPATPFLSKGIRGTPIWLGLLADAVATHAGVGPGVGLGIGAAAYMGGEAIKKYNTPNAIAARISTQLPDLRAAVPDVTYNKPPWLRGGGNAETMTAQEAASNPGGYDARFKGWQKWPGKESVALYDVNKPGHPLHESTVATATLDKNGLTYPPAPGEE